MDGSDVRTRRRQRLGGNSGGAREDPFGGIGEKETHRRKRRAWKFVPENIRRIGELRNGARTHLAQQILVGLFGHRHQGCGKILRVARDVLEALLADHPSDRIQRGFIAGAVGKRGLHVGLSMACDELDKFRQDGPRRHLQLGAESAQARHVEFFRIEGDGKLGIIRVGQDFRNWTLAGGVEAAFGKGLPGTQHQLVQKFAQFFAALVGRALGVEDRSAESGVLVGFAAPDRNCPKEEATAVAVVLPVGGREQRQAFFAVDNRFGVGHRNPSGRSSGKEGGFGPARQKVSTSVELRTGREGGIRNPLRSHQLAHQHGHRLVVRTVDRTIGQSGAFAGEHRRDQVVALVAGLVELQGSRQR